MDRPLPVSDGATAVSVPTDTVAPASTGPSAQTGASGVAFLALQVTPAAGVNVTVGCPGTAAGRSTVTLALPWPRVAVLVTLTVEVPA